MNQKKDDDALVKAALLQALNNQKRSEEKKPEETKPDPKLQEMLKKLGEKLDKLEKDSKENNGGTLPDAVKSFMDTVKEIKEQFAKGNYKLTDEQIQKLHEEAAAAKQSVGDNTPLEKQIDGIVKHVETQSGLGTLGQSQVKLEGAEELDLPKTPQFDEFRQTLADYANGKEGVTFTQVEESAAKLKETITTGLEGEQPEDGNFKTQAELETKIDDIVERLRPEPETPEAE